MGGGREQGVRPHVLQPAAQGHTHHPRLGVQPAVPSPGHRKQWSHNNENSHTEGEQRARLQPLFGAGPGSPAKNLKARPAPPRGQVKAHCTLLGKATHTSCTRTGKQKTKN